MSKITLNIYDELHNQIMERYSALTDPSTTVFSVSFIKAAVALSAVGYAGQAITSTLAARGLLSLTTSEREAFLDKYEVPSQVLTQLQSPGGWPSALSTPTPETPTLSPEAVAAYKAKAKAGIDRFREEIVSSFVTPGFAMAMVYSAKAEEAARYTATGDTDPALYPLLAAEIGVTGETLEEVVSVVNGLATSWKQLAGPLEALRLKAKADIDAEEGIEHVDEIVTTVKAAIQSVVTAALS